MIIQIFISYITGYSQYSLAGDYLPFLNMINIRFMMLQTLIWYILLALSLKIIFNKLHFSFLLLIILIFFQIQLTFEYRNFERKNIEQASYKTYYAKELYKEIDNFIGKPKKDYRIVNIGIEPAISLYNGFYTIDGYSVNYPISYKYQFRKIIARYLNRFIKHQNLTIDIRQLSYMGAEYIFSAYEIEDYKKMHLKFLKKFDNNVTNWPVYLYHIELDSDAPAWSLYRNRITIPKTKSP